MKTLFDFFSSIKLAVILILSLATLLAVGTFYEAAHGTPMAQKFVYHSFYATLIMFLLVVNLVCSAIDRLPWKKYHIGFVVTHAGIITIILGSFLTQQKGIDGILYLPLHDSAQYFSVDNTELRVYQSMQGRPIIPLFQEPVDFDLRPPSKKNYDFKLVDDDELKIIKYVERGLREVHVGSGISAAQTTETSGDSPPAIQFQLQNERVDVQEWLGLDNQLPPYFDFGPALVTFVQGKEFPPLPQPKNQIVILQDPQTQDLRYAIYSQHQGLKPRVQGKWLAKTLAQQPDDTRPLAEVETGWMGLKFRLLHYYPHAKVKIDYRNIEPNAPDDSPNLTPAILAKVGKKESWFELDSPHEIRGENLAYFLSFVRRKYNLGFSLHLDKFKVSMYEGSALPRSYESTVTVNNSKIPQSISMNEPLKFNGYTLYQSSFEQNERGEPIASILAVNYDPGRAVKYLGAIMVVLGIAIMFYIKPRWTRKKTTS